MTPDRKLRNKQRFERQFRFFSSRVPLMEGLRRPGWMIARVIIGLLLIIGGMLAILPVLNVWMIPLGLLLLAIDLPMLQGPVTRMIIYARRKVEHYRRMLCRRQA